MKLSHILDITMEIRDEYTALVNREEIGEQLRRILVSKLNDVTENGGILLLDFTVVTSIHESFFDEFLVPVLKQLSEGFYGNRYLLGFGIDQTKISITGLSKFLAISKYMFLVYSKSGSPFLLGSPSDEHETALGYVHATKNETANQLAIQMNISQSKAEKLLKLLAYNRVIREGCSESAQITYYDSILPKNEETALIGKSISHEIQERIELCNAIERSVHYQLPSGLHLSEFLHFSLILEDARFARRIGIALADHFKELEIDAILTLRTPNNLILSHAVANYLDCNIAAAVFDPLDGVLKTLQKDSLDRQKSVIILVDVIASGWIVRALSDLAMRSGAKIEGICAVVDVSAKRASAFTDPKVTLCSIPLNMFTADSCPLCKENIPFIPAPVIPRS